MQNLVRKTYENKIYLIFVKLKKVILYSNTIDGNYGRFWYRTKYFHKTEGPSH